MNNVRGRLPWYRDDWVQGLQWGGRNLAPATYIFFASALPALAFGQQLAVDTEGTLTVVQVLVSTALSGLVQSIVGGQPLLIMGVAEPIVLIYGFMYRFAKGRRDLGTELFLPWCAWVCVWTSAMCLLLALAGACSAIDKFTRFSGELFGALIAMLFLQVGIKGLIDEFKDPKGDGQPSDSSTTSDLNLINGLWSLILAIGLLFSCLKVIHARQWWLGRSWLRAFLADYGVPLMVVVWSAVSFAVHPGTGVPRRVTTPVTWEVVHNWSVAQHMAEVPGTYIAAALVPGLIVTVLFYFDHNVSSQMAQQPEFNLMKPPAYHYDFAVLSALTLTCGLLGIPPVNGVLPQAPMHTRSLAYINKAKERTPEAPVRAAKGASNSEHAAGIGDCGVLDVNGVGVNDAPCGGGESLMEADEMNETPADVTDAGRTIRQGGHLHTPSPPSIKHPSSPICVDQGDPPGGMGSGPCQAQLSTHPLEVSGQRCPGEGEHSVAEIGAESMDVLGKKLHVSGSRVALLPGAEGRDSQATGVEDAGAQPLEGHHIRLQVREQRVTNLLQSILVAICLAITPAIKQIPTGVLWGYFMYMAVESLEGSQLWERLQFILTDPKKRVLVLQQEHAAYLQTVPFRVALTFTVLQLVYLLGVWALTAWAGIAGVAFPLPIMALVVIRQYLLPRIFKQQHLTELDAASYEELPAISDKQHAIQELQSVGAIPGSPAFELPQTCDDLRTAQFAVESEREIINHEFHGLQVRHYVSQDELHREQKA